MTVLTNIPIWVYFVILAITFMVMHVVAYDPQRTTTRGAGATTAMRIGSSVILLVGLLVMQPAVPVTLLLALALAALGGYLSGRAAPPPRPREAGPASVGEADKLPDDSGVDEPSAPADESRREAE